jgi:adenosylmethionine-8-amino-7-oxononanoate aminotransferase
MNIDTNNIWHPYTSLPAKYHNYLATKANGVYITLDGNKVIDGMSSWWAAIFGYNHPQLNQAMKRQIDDFAHIMFGGITHQGAIDLAKKLINITPQGLDKIFFTDSGSVAIEVAMKMALQYHHNLGNNKTKFITVKGGYHGDTFGAMSVCDTGGMHKSFSSNIMQNIFISRPTLHNTTQVISELQHTLEKHNDIAAFIIEPIIQNTGGMNIYSPIFLQQAKRLCEEFDILFIADEIATGFGRAGKMLACEYADITPDILCIGKALTAGQMSLGATITNKKISDTVGVLMHGPTFMANPLAISCANASIDLLLSSNWQENVSRIEKVLTDELLDIKSDKVKDIRVLGAIGVVEFYDELDINKVQQTLIKNGVWLRPFGKLLYTMPPYITTDEELVKITNAMKQVIQHL